MTGWIGFEILDRSTGSRTRVIVGNWDEGYPDITIGGFTDCSVHLDGPSAEGVRARFFAASHHRFLEVQSAPASSPLFASLGQTKRVDRRPFEIGDFTFHTLEVGLDSTIKGLSAGSEQFERNIANLEPFGLAGKPACPRLLANLLAKNMNVRSKSLETLRKLGVVMAGDGRKQIRSAILQTATDADPAVRFQALEVLAEMREREALRERLFDSDPKVRIWAAVWLWRLRRWSLRRRPEELVAVLVQALTEAISGDVDEIIAIHALGALKVMGPAARPAIPAIALAIQKQVYTARGVMKAIAPEQLS